MYWGSEELRASGHEILLEEKNAPFHWLGTPVGWLLSHMTGWRIPLERIFRLSEKIRECDVVVFGPQALVFGYGLLRRLGFVKKPALAVFVGAEFTERKSGLRAWFRGILMTYAVAGLDVGLSLCPLETEIIDKWVQTGSERFVAIRQGIDIHYYLPRENSSSSAKSPYIVAVGADRYRDWETFAKVASRLPFQFRAIVDKKAVAGISFSPNVELIFNSMMVETRDLMAGAELVLVTTRPAPYFSGFTTMLAAMAMRRPIAYDNPRKGAVYNLKDGVNAIEIPRGDSAGIARILERWMSRPDELVRLGAEGKKIADFNSMDRFAFTLEKILTAIVSGSLGSSNGVKQFANFALSN